MQPSFKTKSWVQQSYAPLPPPSPDPHPNPPRTLTVPSGHPLSPFLPLASSKLLQAITWGQSSSGVPPLCVFFKGDHGYERICTGTLGLGTNCSPGLRLPELFPPSWCPQLTRPLVLFLRLGISSSKSSSSFPSSTFSSFSNTL